MIILGSEVSDVLFSLNFLIFYIKNINCQNHLRFNLQSLLCGENIIKCAVEIFLIFPLTFPSVLNKSISLNKVSHVNLFRKG